MTGFVLLLYGRCWQLLALALTLPFFSASNSSLTLIDEALLLVSDFRTWSHQLYVAHCLAQERNDLLEHCDAVIEEILRTSKHLSRFLRVSIYQRDTNDMSSPCRSLNTSMAESKSRIGALRRRLKGYPTSELSRIRKAELSLFQAIERLRNEKIHLVQQSSRTMLHVRWIWRLVLPLLLAPTFANASTAMNSIAPGLFCGGATAFLIIAGVFEHHHKMADDPFVLDSYDVDICREFEASLYDQLMNVRRIMFPKAVGHVKM
jgi:hypothetical protein